MVSAGYTLRERTTALMDGLVPTVARIGVEDIQRVKPNAQSASHEHDVSGVRRNRKIKRSDRAPLHILCREGSDMSALDDYQKHKRIAEEILSELHQTNLKTASVSRELADAAIAEQAAEIERWQRHQCECADNGLCRKVNAWTNQEKTINEQAERIRELEWINANLENADPPFTYAEQKEASDD
jgi:hypothetical protein